MSRISRVFEKAKREQRAVLIPYITAGFPDLDTSKEILKALAEEGAGVLEVGTPFSDPLADGPTIQKASQVALKGKVRTKDVFDMVKSLRETTDVPVVVMTYYNLFYKYGLERFVKAATKSGIDGVIIPDLPVEEAGSWLKVSKSKLDTIFLVAPTSTNERIKMAARHSQGFIYCVSLTGTTGIRDNLPKALPDFVSRVRKITSKPIAVGFGVSSPSHVREVAKLADGVIIGSAFINLIDKADFKRAQLDNVVKFAKSINKALKKQ